MKQRTRFIKRYTVYTGSQFMAFESADGRRYDVQVRHLRDGCQLYTRTEARQIADRVLYPPSSDEILADYVDPDRAPVDLGQFCSDCHVVCTEAHPCRCCLELAACGTWDE